MRATVSSLARNKHRRFGDRNQGNRFFLSPPNLPFSSSRKIFFVFFPTVRRIQRDYCSRDDNFVRDAAINSIKTLGARDLAYFSFISFESSLRKGTAREFEEKE